MTYFAEDLGADTTPAPTTGDRKAWSDRLCTCHEYGYDNIGEEPAYYSLQMDLFLCAVCHKRCGGFSRDNYRPDDQTWEWTGRDWAELGLFPRAQFMEPLGAVWPKLVKHGFPSKWPRKLNPAQLKVVKSTDVGEWAAQWGEDDDYALAWQPVDLQPIWDGTYQAPEAHWLPRDDGHRLLYKGAVHSFHGEFESGKTWCALGATYSVLAEGGSVLYLDAESTADVVAGRLKRMGVHREVSSELFAYINVDSDPRTGRAPNHVARRYQKLVRQPWDLVIVDGVTEAMAALGGEPDKAKDVAEYMNVFTRPFRKSGAAVVVIDHVTKENGGKPSRAAHGSQHKQSGIDVAYSVVAESSPRIGAVGNVSVYVAKDRLGYVRQHASAEQDRMQLAALVRIDSTGLARTDVSVLSPESPEARTAVANGVPMLDPEKFGINTGAASRVLQFLTQQGGLWTKAEIVKCLGGTGEFKKAAVDAAVTQLAAYGEIDEVGGRFQAWPKGSDE